MDLGARDVRVLGEPVAAEGGGGDLAAVVDPYGLEERGTEGLGDAALDLAAALHGVHDLAGVGGVDAAEDADLPGRGVDGEAEPLGVEGDRAR